jgi:transposase
VYRRLEALLLVAEGHSVAEAARRCRVDRSSVHRWLVQYRAEHEATALCDRPRSGRPRCLIAANRQAASINALAADAAAWVLMLTPQQARRKAGMMSKHFWLRKLLQNFWRPT